MGEAAVSVTERLGCHGLRVDGRRCESVIVSESGWCFSHDPDLETRRRAARERGGVNSSTVRRLKRHLGPSELGPVFDRLLDALAEVHSGELAPQRAAAMGNLARALCVVLEVGELEERLQRLEGRLTT